MGTKEAHRFCSLPNWKESATEWNLHQLCLTGKHVEGSMLSLTKFTITHNTFKRGTKMTSRTFASMHTIHRKNYE